MGGIGHVVSRIVTSSSSVTASYRSKRSRVKDIKLIWLLTLLDQFQNQKDKFAFYFLLLLVVTATQGRRVAEWIQRFQLQSKLDGRAPLIFFGIPKRDIQNLYKVQSCDVLPLDCGHSAPWPCCNVAIHPTQVMMARASASSNSPQNPLFLFESMHSESGRSSQKVSAN